MNRPQSPCLLAQGGPQPAHPFSLGHYNPLCMRCFKTEAVTPTVCGTFRGPGTLGGEAGKLPAWIPLLRPSGAEVFSGRAGAIQLGSTRAGGAGPGQGTTGKCARSQQPRQGFINWKYRAQWFASGGLRLPPGGRRPPCCPGWVAGRVASGALALSGGRCRERPAWPAAAHVLCLE